jgi:hypothetical protein
LRASDGGLANVDDFDTQLGCALLNGNVGALHGHGWEEDAVWEIFEMIEIATDSDLAFDTVIVGLHFGVVDRPVFTDAIVLAAFKIALTKAQGNSIPKHGFAAEAAATFTVKTWLAGAHGGDVTSGKFKGEGVGVEVGVRVDLRAAFEHEDIGTEVGEARGESATAGT